MASPKPVDDSVSAFEFIQNARLRADIEDAISFSTALVLQSIESDSTRHSEEYSRVIILYIAAVIEAVCIYIINLKGLEDTFDEYKYIKEVGIPNITTDEGDLIIGLRCKKIRAVKDIPFSSAIKILRKAKFISSSLSDRLDLVRSYRNTQHLYNRSSRLSNTEMLSTLDSLGMFLSELQKSTTNK